MQALTYQSLPSLFFTIAKQHASLVAAYYKQNESRKDDKTPFIEVSWENMADAVSALAAGLHDIGLKPQDKVGIMSNTCLEWTEADIAIMAAGGVTVSVYHTCSSEELLYLLNDSGQKFIFVEDKRQLDKLLKVCENSQLQGIIIFEADGISKDKTNCKLPIYSFDELIALGQNKLQENSLLLEAIYQQVQPNQLASIVYTSGTSGVLKGVMLTHLNILLQLQAIEHAVPIRGASLNHSLLAFLTSAHIFQRIAGEWYFISQACPVYYCNRIERVGQYLKECPASIILSVPLVLEKIKNKVLSQIENMDPSPRALIKSALNAAITLKKAELSLQSRFMRSIARNAHKMLYLSILKQIKEQISPSLKAVISGGAPLSAETIEFYHAIGIHLIEGYGLTETTGILCCNQVEKIQVGSVGKAFKGVEIKIAEDGEIWARGQVIFGGYLNKPEETSECMTEDGWFKTGDLGHLDREGNLFITGRKKDLIVTAGGKKVSPALLEEKIKSSSLIDQIAIFGDKRKWLVALITLQKDGVKQALKKEVQTDDEWSALIESPELINLLEKELQTKCEGLAEYEKIKRFKILANPFSQAKDELTHTMKVKRRVIEKNYADLIESLYS